jgi:hypothetical protein
MMLAKCQVRSSHSAGFRRTGCWLLTLALAGCAAAEKGHDLALSADNYVGVALVPAGNPSEALRALYDGSDAVLKDSRAEAQVKTDCGAETTKLGIEGLPPVIAALVIEEASKAIIHLLDSALAEELAEYSTEYSQGSKPSPFYEAPPEAGSSFSPKPAWSCIRFVRYDEKPANLADPNLRKTLTTGEARPTLDFVALIKPSPDGDYMSLQPLRLYFRRGAFEKAKSLERDRKVGIAIEATIDAHWRQGNRSESKTVVSTTLVKEAIEVADVATPVIVYAKNHDNWEPAKLPQLNTVPYSVDDSGKPVKGGFAVITMKAAEAGPAPTWLKWSSKVVHDNADKLSGALKDALEKAAGK